MSSSGRKFYIRDAVIWNVFDEEVEEEASGSCGRSTSGITSETITCDKSLEDRSTLNDAFKYPIGQACIFQLRDVQFLS